MKLEALDVLKTRRSVRSFKAEQVKEEELQAVLEAGTYAPTGGGTQAPLIVAVQNRAVISRLSHMNAEVIGKEVDPYYGAPTVIIVFAPQFRMTYVEDASCVLQNLMLAAHAAGLGSCWIHRERQMFGSKEGRALMEEWGIPEDYVGIGAVALGYTEGEYPTAAQRKEGYIIRI